MLSGVVSQVLPGRGSMTEAAVPAGVAGFAAEPVVIVDRVTKRYGSNVVLDGASARVQPGVTGLLGANGAGKTTLIGMLLGLHRPDAGTLTVLGQEPVRSFRSVPLPIGYAPEHHSLPVDVPAVDLVEHMTTVQGLPRAEASGRASDAMWYVGLGEERQRPLGTMSTGQRQRVKLALAIAHDPKLVILDEPTDGLDPTQRETMLDLIRRISTDFGISVLLSSHLLDEVERTCHDVVILAEGRVVANGPISELRGEGRGVSVELDADPSVIAHELVRRGLQVSVERHRLVVQLAAGATAQAPASAIATQEDLLRLIRDLVSDHGLGIRRLAPRTVSLEEFYLQVGR